MATKKQIAEQAMRILAGGHLKPDRTLDIREVMIALDQIRDKMVQISTFENIKMGDYSVEEDYLSFYENVNVTAGGEGNLSYSVLPASVISLYNGMGIYHIGPDDDMEDAFIITKAGLPGLLSGTAALDRASKTYCWPVGDRIYYKNNSESTVTMLLAVTSADIAEDADYPVPPNVENDLLEQLVKVFSIHQQQPHDELEDGNK